MGKEIRGIIVTKKKRRRRKRIKEGGLRDRRVIETCKDETKKRKEEKEGKG